MGGNAELGHVSLTTAPSIQKQIMTDIVAEMLPDTCPAILSGPSFAADVAAGLPTAVQTHIAVVVDGTANVMSYYLNGVPFAVEA